MRAVSIFVLLALLGQSSAQFDEIGECIGDEDFLIQMIGCFAAKFEPLLDMELPLFYSDKSNYEYIGRQLLFTHADDAIRQNNLKNTIKHMHNKGLLNSIDNMAGEVKKGLVDGDLIGKLKQLSLKELGLKAARHFARHLFGVKDSALLIKRVMGTVLDQYKDQLSEFPDIDQLFGKGDKPTAYNIDVCEIIGEGPLCDFFKIGQCIEGYPEEAFEDGIEWVECLFVCDDLPPLGMCMADAFNASDKCRSLEWMKDLILRIFVDIVQLGDCYFKVSNTTGVTVENPIKLEEGGDPLMMEFTTYLPPGVLCFEPGLLDAPIILVIDVIAAMFNLTGPCNVQIQMSTSNYLYDLMPYISLPLLGVEVGRPKCRDDSMMHQAAIGWSEHASDYACTINITNENWNSTFQVPVAATIDNKFDKDIDLNFTLKMVANGDTRNSTKVPMRMVNRDFTLVSTCQSVGDPHILTFDRRHYSNFYHGYFYLYKHETLPYEVQVITQACSEAVNASCNCAVAVKSGDDVFVVDRCRRITCDGDECQITRTMLYTNGELTKGTRIFVRDGGLRYDVLLPQGTHVRIVSTNNMLNVWISPSSADRDMTSGLCGIFDNSGRNDLSFPNGTIYDGEGSEEQGQPRPLIKSWRVPEDERIFYGSYADDIDFHPDEFCKCHHYILLGVQCTCGPGNLVEYCDLDLDGEMTSDQLPSIIRRSALQVSALRGDGLIGYDDDIDLDEDYVPKEFEWDPESEYDERRARTICETTIRRSSNPLIEYCLTQMSSSRFLASRSVANCIEDIKITDTEDWTLSSLDAQKFFCLDYLTKRTGYKQEVFDSFENGTCLHECNNNGRCEHGRCVCDSGFIGNDCGLVDNAPILMMDQTAVCDSRYEDCSFATMFGMNLVEDTNLKCHITTYNMGEGRSLGQTDKVDTIYISENQVACKLPESGSYKIALTHNNKQVALSSYSANSEDFVFLAFDSACYTCDMEAQSCKLREGNDYCFIGDRCFAHGQIDDVDSCSVCNVSVSTQEFSDVPSPECNDQRLEEQAQRDQDREEMVLRSSIAAGLSAIIIIIAVVAFVLDRRSQNRQPLKHSESVTPEELGYGKDDKDDINTTSFGPDEASKVNGLNGGHDNTAYETDPAPRVSKECAEVLRVKEEAGNRRQRTMSQSSVQSQNSVSSFFRLKNIALDRTRTTSQSSGHSGSGPVHLHTNLPTISGENSEVVGYGAHFTGAMTPSGKRKDYEHVSIARL